MTTLSIRDAFAGKNVLVTGTSGFLGKVWLAMALARLPEVGKFYVLLRKKGLRPASQRFEKMVNESPVFKPLHEQFGLGLGPLLSEKVEVIDGDISQPGFGVQPAVAQRLHAEIDLIVNCAGLVDFDPDVREAVATNIDGALYAVDFAADCQRAALLHVSTCYVVGNRSGRIEEAVTVGYTPKGLTIDPAAEVEAMRARVADVLAEHSGEDFERLLADSVDAKIIERKLDAQNPAVVANVARQERDRVVRKAMSRIGSERAAELGWPNTYTWSKSLAEQLLVKAAAKKGVRYTIVRPAIVESSMEFPFPGWNEGFNTAGPLVYLLGTWFRNLPCKKGNPFDVVPVDLVCRALTVASAELMEGTAPPVYQAGSSDLNTFTINRAVELTALAHREHLRAHGESVIDRVILARWEGQHCAQNELLSMKNMRTTAQGLGRLMGRLADGVGKPLAKQLTNGQKAVNTADKQLKGIERMVDLFQPFIHDNTWTFAAQNLVKRDVVEPEWRFSIKSVDWRSYWKGTQVPGLRKWCFPQFEGKDVEKYTPVHPVKLSKVAAPKAAPAVTAAPRLAAVG